MKVIHDLKEVGGSQRKICLAIGMFDGVHLGHQQVIRQTVLDAAQYGGSSLVLTFDQHPSVVVAPERTPLLIYPISQRLRSFEALGVETVAVTQFTRAFSQQSADAFVRNIVETLGRLQSVSVGAEFNFGHNREGNVEVLRELGNQWGFEVHATAAVALDGAVVSSTRIREAIRQGHLDLATQMLGRSYSLTGPVIHGDGLGRKLGFPTANVSIEGLACPPSGVYAIHARRQNDLFRGVVNVGFRPTLGRPAPQLQVEAHLFDFDRPIYGEDLEIIFQKKLREEQKFSSIEALAGQILRDIAAAKEALS